MDKISIREAVKHFHVSRPTLQKALKSGKISGVQDGKGHWQIDPAELARVYQPRGQEGVNGGKIDHGNFAAEQVSDSAEIARLKGELAVAEARAEAAELLAQERANRIEDLRRLLPSSGIQRAGLLSRLFGSSR